MSTKKNLNKLIKKTSVIICNKNSLNYLKLSIPALKKHKLKEILVIDGCSTDGSIEYVKKKKNQILFRSRTRVILLKKTRIKASKR